MLVLVSTKNKLWTKGKLYAIAHEEYTWRRLQLQCGINEYIRQTLTNQTIDSIKGKRKGPSYQRMLQRVIQELTIAADAEVLPNMVATMPPLDDEISEGRASLLASLQEIIHKNNLDNII